MSHYDHALMRDRLSHLETLAQHKYAWTMARRADASRRRRAPRRISDALASLRLRARRGLKGGRSLA